jgi:hypothetical protein
MAVSSLSITSVNLYAEAARTGRGERRERDGSHDCAPCAPKPAGRASVLAEAMRDAFDALGWSRADTGAPTESAPAGSGSEAGPSLDDAVAGFASALAQALKDVRRGESGGEGCGSSGRRWHHSRIEGMAPRIEMLVVQLQAGAAPADEGAAASPSPAPIAAPAPALEPMTIDGTPEAPAEALVASPALPLEAAAPAAQAEPAGEAAPLVVAAPPAPEEPGGLVDAFKNLLDSLRDNGVKIPADEGAADSLVRFLNQLAESLSSRTGASRFDTQPVFSGTFVRIVV